MDYAFAMPEEIPSGWVTFRFENVGQATHYMYIGRRPNGVSRETFVGAVREKEFPPHENVGGPGFHAPGCVSETTVHLEPGDYFVQCAITNEGGQDHYELGMTRHFRGGASDGQIRTGRA